MPRPKVNNACTRCRRQKLKCDVQRPCLLCTRAGVECVASQDRSWKEYKSARTPRRVRQSTVATSRGRKSTRVIPADELLDEFHRRDEPGISGAVPVPQDIPNLDSPGQEILANSSSTMMLVEEAFHQHDCASPEMAEKSALGYSQGSRGLRDDATSQPSRKHPTASTLARSRRSNISQSAILELSKILPSYAVALLLVNNYFDKIHWFMLLFHQHKFRESLKSLYPDPCPTALATGRQDEFLAGYMSVLLAVCALSLRYTSSDQREELAKHNVNAEAFRDQILNVLRLRLLDILALGSLESIQLCVLLGSYYLYHGEPELAWPLCGCALRLAQALELHRRSAIGSLSQQESEYRKRCWWAVHEIETYCSMIYGFPLSISDTDCNADPLDPSDQWSIAADGQVSSAEQPTLLVYKCSMSNLSKIVKSALEDLYRSHQKQSRFESGISVESEAGARLQFLTTKIKSLDEELVQWYGSLPSKLKLERLSGPSASTVGGNINFDASSHLPFDEKLFQLQALALKLAFENARILIHRPLLLFKSNDAGGVSTSPKTNRTSGASDPKLSIYSKTCHDAALQISWAGNMSIFRDATTTYALNFISLHLLTAGVTLGIMTSLNPLSQKSFEAKLGIRRVMEMQVYLKPKSIVADQGLKILKKLLSLVMKKETRSMLDFGPQSHELNKPEAVQESQNTRKKGNGIEAGDGRGDQISDHGFPLNHPPSAGESLQREYNLQTEPVNQAVSIASSQYTPTAGSMLNIEQAFIYPTFLTSSDEELMLTNAENNGYAMIGQDQGWLWGSEIGIGSLE